MSDKPFTKEERQELLSKIEELYNKNYKSYSKKRHQEIDTLEQLYKDKLPIIPVSCCPICKTSVYTTFDFYGLDGDWWRETSRTGYKTQACEHFYLFSGAFNSNNIKIKEKNRARVLRPLAPFITLEEINEKKSIAVISRVDMEPGYYYYIIAYFSDPAKKTGRFHNIWKRDTDLYIDENGKTEWGDQGGVEIFDLLPWIKKGKVFWCDPESGNMALSTKPAEECPFLNLPQD